MTQEELRNLIQDITSHLIVIILSTGFLGIIFAGLLGFVNLESPVVAALFTSIVQTVATVLGVALWRYFNKELKLDSKDSNPKTPPE